MIICKCWRSKYFRLRNHKYQLQHFEFFMVQDDEFDTGLDEVKDDYYGTEGSMH